MDSFDWTKDKAIYQRWHMWSEKARHTLDAMEGDSEKSKISYFHHWIDGKGMGKIESWKDKKILISREEYDKLDETQKEGKYSSEKIESYLILLSTEWVDHVEEPMKYQALRPHLFSAGWWGWVVVGCGWWWGVVCGVLVRDLVGGG